MTESISPEHAISLGDTVINIVIGFVVFVIVMALINLFDPPIEP